MIPQPVYRNTNSIRRPLHTWPPEDPHAPALRVLMIEDDPEMARLTSRRLRWSGAANFAITHASDLESGLRHLESARCDAVLLDLTLPGSDGLGTIAAASAVSRHVPIVVLTSRCDHELSHAAMRAGAQDYLVKDDQDARTISRAVLNAIERHEREERLATFSRGA